MASSYTIGERFEGLIKDLVESGRYSTASEVIRDGLRLIDEREERRKAKLEALRRDIREGLDSGPAEAFNIADTIEDVKRRGRENLKARQHGA